MRRSVGLVAGCALVLASCGGGGTSSPSPSPAPAPTPTPTPTGLTFAPPTLAALTTTDVEQVIAQAVAEARARNQNALIAVVDRPGNVLAMFRMTGALPTALVRPAPNGDNRDAQNQTVPATAAAIAKAVTGAYLSSNGNAFSTRTANMIVQPAFPPQAAGQGLESGPLYGVQFSQLPCSDLNARYAVGNAGAGPFIGPKRSPLGLAADAGGLPLYRGGVLVGGVGIMIDGDYGFDSDSGDIDTDIEELVALAATRGFEAPEAIRADRIPVDGTTLRYTDASYAQVGGGAVQGFAAINGTVGTLIPVTGYYGFPTPVIQAGTSYGSEASGMRLATSAEFARADAMVLSDGAGAGRYPIRGGTDAASVASPMTAAETRALLEEAFAVMARSRAQIRRPLDSQAQVTVSVVDTHGAVLGLVRSPDAPLFGIDVSLQKARSAAFLSNPLAGANLLADPDAAVRAYVPATRSFLNDPAALTGQTALSNRAIGLIHRPHYPDGELSRPAGPLSRDTAGFNPFSTGLQTAMTIGAIAAHLSFIFNLTSTDTPQVCTNLPATGPGQNRLTNGLQIFPGSVPIYRGSVLIGGIGVSGDGIDQDDMVSFLSLANAGTRLSGSIANAPTSRRADQVVVRLPDGRDARLRYVNCPFGPFLDSTTQNVCQGL